MTLRTGFKDGDTGYKIWNQFEFSPTLARRTVTITKIILKADSDALLQNKKYFRNQKKERGSSENEYCTWEMTSESFFVESEDGAHLQERIGKKPWTQGKANNKAKVADT